MSAEAKEAARLIFEGKQEGRSACVYCGGIHVAVAGLDIWRQPCPRVKIMEIDGGQVKRVEFWPNGDWESNVVFPEDVYDDADASE